MENINYNKIILAFLAAFFIILIAILFSKKLKDILVFIKDGLREEYTTTAGAICFAGVIFIFVLAYFSEASSFLTNFLSPEKMANKSEISDYYGAIIAFLGNLFFLGYTKPKS